MMFFMFGLYVLMVTRSAASHRYVHVAEGAVLGLLSCFVGYGRVYLGYHDLPQVNVLSLPPLLIPLVLESGGGIAWCIQEGTLHAHTVCQGGRDRIGTAPFIMCGAAS